MNQRITAELEAHRTVSQTEIATAQKRLSGWGGSGREVTATREIVNLHWPKIAFIEQLLKQEVVTEIELEIVRRGTLTQAKLLELTKLT